MRISVSETIAAPPERVFAAMTDLEGAAAWMHGLVRLERLTDGPIAVGSRWRETRRILGREGSEVFEVTGMEPGRSLDLYVDGTRGSSRRGEYRFRHVVEPSGTGTRLRIDGEISGMGLAARVLAPLLRGQFQKAIAKDLAGLKRHLEAA
jgi:carbon monoxide dehydrogenase subunit G